MSDTLAIHGGTPVRARPWPSWPEFGDPERAALRRVLESRNWGGFPSPNTEARAFAAEFAAYIGSEYAVSCANGTFSLTLALQAARVNPGAEVITSAYTFVGTAGGIIAAGCVPVLVDVAAANYCIDPDGIEAAITERTEAILPVHLGCSVADMDRICEIAERRGLIVVEDCAHAHGARWRDRGVGSIGALGSFSMQSSKMLTAGEGGAVTTSDPVFEQRLQSLVNCGRKESGYDAFPEQMLGHNLRITEWQAGVLREQLRRLPEQHRRRTENLATLQAGLGEIAGISSLVRDERVTHGTCYQVILRYDAAALCDVPRDVFIRALQAEGVPCAGRFYVPLNEDPLLAADPATNPLTRAGVRVPETALPVARRAAYDEAIWLPHELFLGRAEDVADLLAALGRVTSAASMLRQ